MSSSEDDFENVRVYSLHVAAERGDVEAIDRLLQQPAEDVAYMSYGSEVNERSRRGYTALHVAIVHRQLGAVERLLAHGAELRKLDGSPCLHFALCLAASDYPGSHAFVEEVAARLLPHADPLAKDDRKQTALHICAAHGLSSTMRFLLSKLESDAVEMKDRTGHRAIHYAAGCRHAQSADVIGQLIGAGANVNCAQVMGSTPLHCAAQSGNWESYRTLLKAGADASKADKRGRTPVRLAAEQGLVVPTELCNGEDATVAHPMLPDTQRTLVLSHPLCRQHYTCGPIGHGTSDPPPENADRLKVIMDPCIGALRATEFSGLEWDDDAPRAKIADILRCHEYNYVHRLQSICASLPDDPNSLGFLDGDTAVSARTFEAAMRAAGSVIEGVDRVMSRRNRNVFCAVRPPGHHAGPRGVVTSENDGEGDGSHGFCLLNNVGIAAAYARHMYRDRGVERICIVDFDVHHGNGTEAVVRGLVPRREESVVRTPFAEGRLHTLTWKPWLDESDPQCVLFVSSHGYGKKSEDIDEAAPGGWFYPGSGRTCMPKGLEEGDVAAGTAPQGEGEGEGEGEDAGTGGYNSGYETGTEEDSRVLDVGLRLATREVSGTSRSRFRDAYRKVILPRIVRFDPDLILISAGFDAHRKDDINFGYIGLVEEDFEWVTEQLCKVANRCCEGRVVSVLEGGYAIKGGHVSAFSRSVASHVRALQRCSRSSAPWRSEDAEWESAFEAEMLEKVKERLERKERESLSMMYSQFAKPMPDVAAPKVLADAGAEMAKEAPAVAAVPVAVAAAAAAVAAPAPAPAALGSPPLSVAAEAENPRKRRRGAPVDYVALNAKLAAEESK